jgi:uncharacterized protein DUF1206
LGSKDRGGDSPDDWTVRMMAQPFGTYIIGAVALGLVAYSVFMFVMARYRRIEAA